MQTTMGQMPRPEEIAAIEYEARRARAEVFARGARAAVRAVMRLLERALSSPAARA